MIQKLSIFLLFVYLGVHTLHAQQRPKQFDEDMEKYPETVAGMFAANASEDDKALIARFGQEWNNGTFSGNEQLEILNLSNAFLEKKARNIHYLMLWRCLLAFKEPENTMKGYEAWMKAMLEKCKDRRMTPTALQTIMSATFDILGKQIIYATQGNEWKTSGEDFRFDFTDNQLSVIYGTGDIYCLSKNDSIVIGQTSGQLLLTEQLWIGKGGVVTWERAGFGADEVFARLGDYRILMKQSQYEADSVWLTHKTYFPSPVQGKLIDKVRHNPNPQTAIYPEFITYEHKFVFEDLYPDLSYEGGITIQGARTIGSGTETEKASIRIAKGDSLQMDITSKSFVLRADRVNARNVSLNIRLGEDSIFHSNLSFVYLVDSKEVSFLRSDAASSKAPYNDSYHKLDMDFEQLIWKTDEPLMSMSMTRGSAIGRAQFRSQNYFDQRYFESLQYFDAVHPLVSLRKCAETYYSNTFSSEVYARYIRRPISTARAQLIEIAKLGFIIYNGDTDEVTLQPRLYEFLAAASKQSDFDVIDLHSSVQTPGKNAMFDTRNYDLQINGLEKFSVSDSQKVIITPRKQSITVKKDRSMDIDGRIEVGQMELFGDSLHFDYDTFKIDLYKADSLFMYVPSGETDAFGMPVLKRVNNAIEKIDGRILIDLPGNKSGLQSAPEYPVLVSDSVAYVYYGAQEIEGGAYDREKFFFEVSPFVMDSIDNFSKEALVITGKFVSADIFNDMEQELRVQPDYSLGFIYETGDSSISAYNNAKMYAEIRLSNEGLRGSGQLDYLTASVHADDFRLYPDSMLVPSVKEFTLRKQTEGTEYPDLKSEGNRIKWLPKEEKMYISKGSKAFDVFDLYNSETTFDGELLLTSDNLSGKGRMTTGTADITSDSLVLKSNSFTADTSVFRLRSSVGGPLQMVTVDSVQSFVDYDTRKGVFVPNADYAVVQFPSNNFAAYVDHFRWDMDSTKVHIGADTLSQSLKDPVGFKYSYPGEGKGSRFYSTSRTADSLNFVASSATFDYFSGNLNARGVNLVKTADAIVFPDDGTATITSDGAVVAKRAHIVFNDSLKQHTVHSANVKITGRNQYTGSGKYDYIDETGKISPVEITKIGSDRSGKTIANGNISAEDDFMLSPFFRYRGKLTLSSEVEYSEFDGVAQIVEECETIHPDWFSFKAPVNPADVRLPVSEAPVNHNNSKIYNGLFLTNDSTHIYPAFFSGRRNYSDNPLIQAHGLLSYDKDSMIYFLAPEEKLRNRDTLGNMLAFDRDACLLTGEGKLSLGVDLGRVKTDAVGRIVHNLNNRETTLDMMMALDFLFDDGLAGMLAGKIDSFPSLSGVDMSRERYIRGMNEWLGVEKAAVFRRDALLGKVRNFPEELKHTLVLTQLRLSWNQSSRSYRSTGKIGVGNLFGHQVNRLVDGLVEISKRPGGDFMDIYLKLDNNNWFYFGYTRELMQIISSDKSFNERLMGLPEKQRKMEEKRPGFTYMIASGDKLDQFLRQFGQQTRPVEEPSPVQRPGAPVQRPAPETPVSPPPSPLQTPVEEDEIPIVEIE